MRLSRLLTELLWPPCVADADIIFSSFLFFFLWPPYGIGQAIIFLRCGFFYLLSSSFPRLISAVGDWMSIILPHMVEVRWKWNRKVEIRFSANLERRSEMCCTRLAEKRTQKIAKNSPSGHHRTTLSGYIFTTKACIDNRKRVLNSNNSPTCSHNMANFGPLATEIC